MGGIGCVLQVGSTAVVFCENTRDLTLLLLGQMDPKGDSLEVREVLEGGAAQKQGMLPGTDFVERMRYVFLRQCEDASHTEDASCEMHLVRSGRSKTIF